MELTSIPSGLFDNCQKVTSFEGCFGSCEQLASIPSGLFDHCPKVTSFEGCFRNCIQLSSNLPLLWVQYYGKAVSGLGCFINCTNAENWLEIPKSWGGLADEYSPSDVSGVVLADYRALDTRLRNIENKLNIN